MRLKSHDNSPDDYKVIFSNSEFEQLLKVADNRENPDIDALDERTATDRAILMLGGRVGLRCEEISHARVTALSSDEYGRHYLRVGGKNTRGGSKKTRYSYVPDDAYQTLLNLLQVRSVSLQDASPDERLIPIAPRTVRYRIEKLRERMVEEAGTQEWAHLSTHDLRRRYAQWMLQEVGVNIRHVMSWGGWDDFDSIKPYLAEPSPEAMHNELERVGLS